MGEMERRKMEKKKKRKTLMPMKCQGAMKGVRTATEMYKMMIWTRKRGEMRKIVVMAPRIMRKAGRRKKRLETATAKQKTMKMRKTKKRRR